MNTKNPKISVIIPVYNTSIYLRQCLDSVLEQDFDDYEVICVNDGSTDDSLEILREYEKKSSKIKVIDQTNSGVATTRNTGLKNASGDFLAFLDSDDFIRENYLSKLYNAALKTKSDIVICNFYRYYEQTNFAKPVFYRFRRGQFNKYEILKGLIPDNLIHSYLWNKLWKREIFENHNIFPNMKFEDLRNYKVKNDKIYATGWKPKFSLPDGIEEMKKIFLEGRIKNTNDPVYSNVAFLQSINFENER